MKHTSETKKKMKLIVVAVCLVFIGWQAWLWYAQPLHQPISVDEVDSMMVWGEGLMEGRNGREATGEELAEIVKWFNAATDIRHNRDFAGTTPPAGIVINLKSHFLSKEILILASGKDFEIQRNTNRGRISYWAIQPELKEFLQQLTKGYHS